MTVRDTPWPPGTPCWTDLTVPDRRAAQAFYGALFGWACAEGGPETGYYTMCQLDGRPVAGIGEPMPGRPAPPPAWTTYLAVLDADAAIEAVGAAGGLVIMAPMGVLDVGRMAVVADPTGAVFGLWQAGTHTGIQLANVPRTLTWNECMTRDTDRAKEFYRQVFGYGFEDYSAPGFDYCTVSVAGNIVGGIGGMPANTPEEIPAHWRSYFAVSDVDTAAARVVELGGAIASAPEDTPHGRMSLIIDNQGAPLTLAGPVSQAGSSGDPAAASATT